MAGLSLLQQPLRCAPSGGRLFARDCEWRADTGTGNGTASGKVRIESRRARVCRREFSVARSCASIEVQERRNGAGDRELSSAGEENSGVADFYGSGGGRGVGADSDIPLLEALANCAAQDAASFHFPGHRRGRAAPSRMLETVGHGAFAHDLPELPELDNLFSPDGVIAEAQAKAAALFGADATFFLVNGSTCGIQASVMATCRPGDFLILPRNCHLSATSAMVLSGALPKYVVPLYDRRWGIAHGVSPLSIHTAITEVKAQGGRVGAVLVVSPTYFGVCSSIDAVAKVCHDNGVPLIVDEAHGAHFRFHEDLPESALEQGADIAVQSTHKVLGSLTQSSMLHVRGARVSQEVLGRCLQMVQSTSPSYLLLSSLDAARAQMSEGGQFGRTRGSDSRLDRALVYARNARERLKAIPSLSVMDEDTIDSSESLPGLDPLRITLDLRGLSIDGYEVDDILRLEFGVIAELPALQTITFAVSLGSCERDIDMLVDAFVALSSRYTSSGTDGATMPPQDQDQLFNSSILPLPSARGLSPRNAFFSKTVKVDVADSVGKICAELVCPYPPGIPVIRPGEVISEDAISYLRRIVKNGGSIAGLSDATFSTIQICQE
ncbi:arginine decarboxylase [Marchantia polymorpha subsp. ruderalis]